MGSVIHHTTSKRTSSRGSDPFVARDIERIAIEEDEDISEAGRVLQQQVVDNGEVLDIALESMRRAYPIQTHLSD